MALALLGIMVILTIRRVAVSVPLGGRVSGTVQLKGTGLALWKTPRSWTSGCGSFPQIDTRPLCICLLIVFAAWVPSAASRFVEKSILVTVLDKDGAPIRDLTAAEFTVLEDGRRREVTSAELAAELLFVSVMVDTTKLPDGDVDRLRDLRTSLATFAKTIHARSPTAEIALRAVGGAGMVVSDFTTVTAELEKATTRVVPDLSQGAVVLEAL